MYSLQVGEYIWGLFGIIYCEGGVEGLPFLFETQNKTPNHQKASVTGLYIDYLFNGVH